MTVRYQLDGEDVVSRVRATVGWLHEVYREVKARDIRSRPEQCTLLQRLSESRVMPSEMATMLGVDLHLAERIAGDDQEARMLFHRLNELHSTGRQEAHA